MFDIWSQDSKFERQAKIYCHLREEQPDLLQKCNGFIPERFADYYDALGVEGMEYFQWREKDIRQALEPTPEDKIPHDKIAELIKQQLVEGEEYTVDAVKGLLINIYKQLNIQGKPSATDVGKYITIKPFHKRIDKKKTAMIKVVSYYRKNITYFPSIWNVKLPKTVNIDDVLGMIKNGDIQEQIEKARGALQNGDKDRFDELKHKLPVIAWNGEFTARDKSGCKVYSSFTAMDFDHIPEDEMAEFSAKLQSHTCVYAYFKSPSGQGYKAIVLHDNDKPEDHTDLYRQLVEMFGDGECDSSTSDLGRGNYLSYDPDLWINPKPVPYHYTPSIKKAFEMAAITQTVIVENGKGKLVDDDKDTCEFLNKLGQMVVSDEKIITMLDKAWNQKTLERGRNVSVLSYAGVLCKAGVNKEKAIAFIHRLIPDLSDDELRRASEAAYERNIFGCNRLHTEERTDIKLMRRVYPTQEYALRYILIYMRL